MGEKREEVFKAIKRVLLDGPKSISEISKEANINWRTAEENLTFLKNLGIVKEIEIKNTRTFYYKENDTYFGLPVKENQRKLISTIYYYIKKFSKELLNQEPTKTQAYKIISKINDKLKLNLPIGWYLYGPCCVQIYKGDESEEIKLSKENITIIKETTEKYCRLDNFQLQNEIYKENNEHLYLIKQELTTKNFKTKEEISPILMDLIKYSPQEAVDVVTDFARATLLLGLEKTRTCLDFLWNYLARIRFRDSLKDNYQGSINWYLDIEDAKKDAQLHILDLVRSHVESKHSQDKLYQRWVKKKK